MLLPDELASLRATMEASFPDSVQVVEETTATGLEGGTQVTGTSVRATYAGRVQAQTTAPVEVAEGGRTASLVFFDILLPYNATIKPTDTLRVNGQVYQVVDTDHGGSEAIALLVTASKEK